MAAARRTGQTDCQGSMPAPPPPTYVMSHSNCHHQALVIIMPIVTVCTSQGSVCLCSGLHRHPGSMIPVFPCLFRARLQVSGFQLGRNLEAS